MKTKLILGACLLGLSLCSCKAPAYLPQTDEIDVNPYGSYIELEKKDNTEIKGELIAVDNLALTVLTTTGERTQTVAIPVREISGFKLLYAQPENYGWTIPVYALASVTHGVWLLLTMPVNLFVTISATVRGKKDFQYSDENMTYERLRMFARFPQGIPAHIDLGMIK